MYGVLCGDVSWTALCMAFCVEMQVGLQYVWHSLWRCNLDCNMYGVLCGDVSWTAVHTKGPLWQSGSVVWCVCIVFCAEM